MAKARYIQTKFWSDAFIQTLEKEEKLFFLYLLTNEHTNILGIYEITIATMVFESGLKEDEIRKAIDSLSKAKKLSYFENHIILVNFLKNQSLNPKVKKGIERFWADLSKEVKEYICTTDSLYIAYHRLSHLNLNLNLNNIAANAAQKKSMFEEPTIEVDKNGEEIEQTDSEVKLPRGFITGIARYYMAQFKVPETKGAFYAYQRAVKDMIELARKIHTDPVKIDEEIRARINIAKKFSDKQGWKKMKLLTICENWNLIYSDWRKQL